MEIERKWLIKGFPTWPFKAHYYIFQSYISVYDDCEIRIRYSESAIDNHSKTMSPYKFTYKGGGKLARNEVEKELTAKEFDELKQTIPYPAIYKDFYTFQFDGKKVEMSHVDNDFYYAEVEFKTIEEANAYQFPWPELVIEDVTENERYKMKNYWCRTRLKKRL